MSGKGGPLANYLEKPVENFVKVQSKVFDSISQLWIPCQVLIAFQEVEDALADLHSYAKQYELAIATEQWAQKTYQLYLDRYTSGVIYYVDVVNTERDLLNYQIAVNNLNGFRYVSTIQFIKALGGGW